MARAEIRSQSWGVVQDAEGNVQPGLVFTIDNTDASSATVYTAGTGGSTTTPTTSSDGEISGWLEEGSYDVTDPRDSDTQRVEVVTGLTASRIAVTTEAPLNVQWPEYGALGDGSNDDTAEIQAVIDAAYAAGGGTVFFPPGSYKVTTLAKTWTGPVSVNLVGSGKRATVLANLSGTAPVLNFTGTAPMETYSDIRDLAILGTSKANDGIKITGLARFTIENVDIRACDKGIHNLGGLVFNIDKGTIQSNNIGLYNRISGSTPPNLITVSRSQINSNTNRGIDHGSGQQLIICDGSNLEQNGTTDDLTTGGLYVQNTVDDPIGYAQIVVRDTWFESNLGRSIQAYAGDLILDTVNILSSEDGRAIYSDGNRSLVCRSVHAPSPGDTLEATASTPSVSLSDSIFNVVTADPPSLHRFNLKDNLGSWRGFHDLRFTKAQAEGSVPTSSLFVDSANGKLSFKDSGGTTTALY